MLNESMLRKLALFSKTVHEQTSARQHYKYAETWLPDDVLTKLSSRFIKRIKKKDNNHSCHSPS